MTQSAWTCDGRPVDAAAISGAEWKALTQITQLGDFVMPCCKAPAVLKTSINGLPFFAHHADECGTAPETIWHKAGKTIVLAASAVECYWLVRTETFRTLGKATSRLLLKRDFGSVFPPGGIGTGMLPELPVAMLDTEGEQLVQFGGHDQGNIYEMVFVMIFLELIIAIYCI